MNLKEMKVGQTITSSSQATQWHAMPKKDQDSLKKQLKDSDDKFAKGLLKFLGKEGYLTDLQIGNFKHDY